MKKVLLIFIVVGLFMLITSERNVMLCKKIIGAETNSQALLSDEYFENLSQNYYGTPIYSKELALVNNSVSNLTNEDVVIPSYEMIKKLKQEQSFSVTID